MKNSLIKILNIIQFVIFVIFTISQQVFFNSLWTGSFISLPGLTDIITPMSSFLIWPGIILILISIIQLSFLKIRITLIFGLLGTSLLLYVFLPEFQLIPYFTMHLIIPLFTISGFILIFYSYILFLVLIFIIIRPNMEERKIIKKTILDLGTQFTRLQVREISEECEVNRDFITKIIREMINNKEIQAEYFKSSKEVAFNQEENIEQIDNFLGANEK